MCFIIFCIAADSSALSLVFNCDQEDDFCVYGGIIDKQEGSAELGFGIQVLKDSQGESYFEMVSVISSPADPSAVRSCRMKLEQVLSRTAAVANRGRENDDSSSLAFHSNASIKHAGPVRFIECMVEGEHHNIPILRCLRVDGPTDDRRGVHTWFEYDPSETVESRPSFSFKELQATLAACSFSLPQLSGRWRLEEVGDYPGFSAFTIVAVPMSDGASANGSGEKVQCMVVALQSNDEEEWVYEHFYVGHGFISTTAGGCYISATLRKNRLNRSRRHRQWSLDTLQGTPDRLRLSSGSELVRMTVIPADTAEAATSTGVPPPLVDTMAADTEVRRLLRHLVPDVLDFGEAVQAGDARRVEELLSAAGPGPDLTSRMKVYSRLGQQAVPLVAAALGGKMEVVEVLLGHQLQSLDHDPWTLACAAVCSPRAEAALLAQLSANPRLREATCPHNHNLSALGMDGCSLVEIAVLARGAALARTLVAQCGCSHTLATAVQSGDVAWLEQNTGLWVGEVNMHFIPSGATALVAGFTPLIAAAAASDAAVVECLLKQRANPFVCRLDRTSTAINYAQARLFLSFLFAPLLQVCSLLFFPLYIFALQTFLLSSIYLMSSLLQIPSYCLPVYVCLTSADLFYFPFLFIFINPPSSSNPYFKSYVSFLAPNSLPFLSLTLLLAALSYFRVLSIIELPWFDSLFPSSLFSCLCALPHITLPSFQYPLNSFPLLIIIHNPEFDQEYAYLSLHPSFY